ncbi:MAG: S49 family peptidase, partial [Raoultibacter sp.]
DTITSSESKDSSYGNRPLTEEERVYYQDQVTQINETFIATVAEGRGMAADEVRALATGLTFTGMDAIENGLADELGTQGDAVAKAASLANTPTTKTVTLQDKSPSFLDLMSLMSSSNVSADELAKLLKEQQTDGSIAR